MATTTILISDYTDGAAVAADYAFPVVSMRDHTKCSFSFQLTGDLAGKLRIEVSDNGGPDSFIPTSVEVEITGKTSVNLEREVFASFVRAYLDYSSGSGTITSSFTAKI